MKRFLVLMVVLLVFAAMPCSAEERTESQDNNTLVTAEEFAVGDSMIAQLSDEGDVDYFKINIPKDGNIHFLFTPFNQADAIYSYSWNLTVYGPDQKTELLSGSLAANKTTQFEVKNVKAGTHYLEFRRVSGGNPLINGYSKQSFSICAQVSCSVHGALKDWEISKEATCKQTGEKVQRCTICNMVVKTEKIPKSGHTYADWIILKEATIMKDGKRESSCIHCGREFQESFSHPMTVVFAFAFVGGIILIIIVASVIAKKTKKEDSDYVGSWHYSGSSSSSNDYGYSSYNSGDSSCGSSSYDDPTIYGYAYDYNPTSNTYTNADGVTMTLDKDYVVADDGSIHLDVSDL